MRQRDGMERAETVRYGTRWMDGTEQRDGMGQRVGTGQRDLTKPNEPEQDREGRNRTDDSTGFNGTGLNWTE